MPQGWTIERVLQLAPDQASAKAGQGLASARKWVSTGGDQAALWGECQGSGAKPYQVQVDLAEMSSKCSCPSRKFPCKHSLALMMLWASDTLTVTQRPPWVDEWLAGRAARAQKKQERAEAPPKEVDVEAQAKRRAKRMDCVAKGITSLKTWTEDLIRSGIATAPSHGYAFFDEPARRMIDAQAPGAARMIHNLGSIAMSGANWQEPFLSRLSNLYLLVRAFEQIEQLPENTVEDILAAAGIPQPQEEILAEPGTNDQWQILAQEVEVEDRLRVQKTWLFGVKTSRPALIFNFAHGTAPFDASLQPGTQFDGEICFFGVNQIRAAVKTKSSPTSINTLTGCTSLADATANFGKLLAHQPWLDEIIIPLKSVTPAHDDGHWLLLDSNKDSLPMMGNESSLWILTTLSGGQPRDLAAAFDGHRLRPLSTIANGSFTSLTTVEDRKE
jgi:hypothetical protein